jgi:16S rRNA (cytosine1402-N4)-methyltransferase
VSAPRDDSSHSHRRRPRYRGTHPRRYAEKYKELAPEQYPVLVARLRERGRTPAGQHVSILVDAALAVLDPKPGERGVDATLGWGGHAERLLQRLSPGGQLLGLDADSIELPKTEARFRQLGTDEASETSLLVRRTNFAGIRAAIDEVGWHDGVDFVLADLGVSSMQIDDPARGFSFRVDGPLDMRMNPKRGLSARQWLERASLETLARALESDADEPHARHIAAALVAARGTIETTRALADTVRDALAGRVAKDDADLSVRRVFQTLRIEVNDEFGALDALLRQLPTCLRPGGRVAVLTFHSGEDRRVKKAFDQGERDGVYASVSQEVIRASPAEQRLNPRSRSAKLRHAQRVRG